MDDILVTKQKKRGNRIRLVILLFVIGITILVLVYRDRFTHLGVYGYPGIFLLSIVANATVIIPVPGVLLTSAMGAVFNPFWVAVAAGSGAALGELSGYLAGFSGQAIIKDTPRYEKLVNWMRRYGDITVLVLALIPNPAFDLAGITAGALKLPIYRFLFWCWLGKIGKMLIFAYAGASIFSWFPG
ncbi:MAG: VTT domain-containing protein [Anaerolineaceae bacterium]|nr:VTT domain-containing protein [Anaerolineaceae bacterium]